MLAPLPNLPQLTGEDRATFLSFSRHGGNIDAVLAERSLDHLQYYEWAAKPLVQSWISFVVTHHKHARYVHATPAYFECFDTLRDLEREHKDDEGRRKAATTLLRLSTPQSPSTRTRKPPPQDPGQTIHLGEPDPP